MLIWVFNLTRILIQFCSEVNYLIFHILKLAFSKNLKVFSVYGGLAFVLVLLVSIGQRPVRRTNRPNKREIEKRHVSHDTGPKQTLPPTEPLARLLVLSKFVFTKTYTNKWSDIDHNHLERHEWSRNGTSLRAAVKYTASQSTAAISVDSWCLRSCIEQAS